MSLIANLIRHNPDNWREILREKGIAFRTDGTLASFNYRISADFFDPVVQEARGIILDMENLDVVCYPFRKFGNYGEPYIDDIDWNTARVLEKVDGSIMKAYWYDGKWCLATNSTINADNTPVNNTDKTFGGLFREAAENQGLDFDVLDKNKTYIFELTSPYNKVVVDYGETPKIWHLGTRDNITGQESEENIGIVKPKEYLLSNLDSCIEAVKMMNQSGDFIEDEGFVVVDGNYHRIKIKSPEYIIIHSVIPNGNVSDKYLLKHMRNEDIDDILAYRPDLTERVEDIKKAVKDVERRIWAFSEYWKKKVSRKSITRKEFALAESKTPYFPFAVPIIYEDRDLDMDIMHTKYLYGLVKNRPVLNIMVGVPASGKTRYAEEHRGVHISSDEIREDLLGDVNDQTQNGRVFNEFHTRVKEALLSGRSVYADATNISAKDRASYREAMDIAWKTRAVVFAVPFNECVRRDTKRDRMVGEKVIRKIMRRFEMPFTEEGFDEIEIVRACSPVDMTEDVLAGILSQMDGFDQTSRWHTEDLKTHSMDAWKYFREKHNTETDRIAALLHDIGKLDTRTYDEKGAHFFCHGNVGVYRLLTEYGFPMLTEEEYMKMLLLVCYHDRVIKMKKDRINDMFGDANARYLLDFREADVKASKRKEADML